MAAPGFQQGRVIHRVAWGESLYGIAAQYGVTVDAILRQNGLVNPDMIYVGQPLVIPYTGPARYPGGPGVFGCANYYIVRTGETLSSIAWKYNTTVYDLLRLNNLYNQNVVYVGQRICVPFGRGYAPQPASYSQPVVAPYYHTVTSGETLSSIADYYGVNYWNLMQANNLQNPGFIWAGQRLVIPGYQPPQPRYSDVPSGSAPPPAYDYGYGDGPDYGPPPAPTYEGTAHDDFAPYKEPKLDANEVPPAPDYQASPVAPILPLAEHPLEVVVNSGETWADNVYPTKDDPNGITTLIVQTGEELDRIVRVRSGDFEAKGKSEFSAEFGAFRFVFRYIPPGDYDVWIDDPETPSEVAQVDIESGDRIEVAFSKQVRFQGQTFASPDGWVLSGWENPSKPGQRLGGWSNILVKTPASGLLVNIASEGGGYKAQCFTGSKGPGACDFAGLSAGIYFIWIDGTELTLKTYMDGNAYATFEFSRQSVPREDKDKVGPVNYD